jgi:hypothetical protein
MRWVSAGNESQIPKIQEVKEIGFKKDRMK